MATTKSITIFDRVSDPPKPAPEPEAAKPEEKPVDSSTKSASK